MSEIILFINIISKETIAEIGSKEVIIKIHSQVRVHATKILWIFAGGTKVQQC